MLTAIVAADLDNAIGRDGDMPWRLKADMRHFRDLTMGHTVLMGRRTWQSLFVRPLPGRRNVVISTTLAPSEGCEVARSVDEALAMTAGDGEVYIIGGAHIYNELFGRTDRIILTRVHTHAEGADCHFPAIDPALWDERARTAVVVDEGSGLGYEYITYCRK